MLLRKEMIDEYLSYITSLVFVDPDDVTEDMSVYDDAIEAMAGNARYDENLEYLRLAMDFLIANPENNLEQFYGSGYPFSDRELHAILQYAYQSIWPDEPISEPGEAAPVQFVDMSEPDWNASRSG